MASVATPGWFPDPARRYRLRYWDGHQWTAWATDGDRPILDADSRRPPRALVILWGASAVVAMPLAVWWLVGDTSVTSRPRDQLDYMWHAPAISGTLTAIVGVIALVTVAIGVVMNVVATRRRVIDPRWLLVFAAFLFAGGLFALIGRVVSAGTIGANIGGGLALLLGVPLVGYAVIQAKSLIVGQHRPRPTP